VRGSKKAREKGREFVYIGDGVDGIINSAETADTARHGLKGGGALLTRRSVGADLDG
jgi:hypothetical protein